MLNHFLLAGKDSKSIILNTEKLISKKNVS